MKALKEILPAVIQDIEIKKRTHAEDAPELLLKKVFQKKALNHIRFQYLRQGILGISVDSSGWLYQLSLQKEALLLKLQKKSPKIQDIRFRLGEVGRQE